MDVTNNTVCSAALSTVSLLQFILVTEMHIKIDNVFRTQNSDSPVMKRTKGKGNAIPLQTWTGPEDSRRLKLPDFKTTGT
jgi:hypothetical protein